MSGQPSDNSPCIESPGYAYVGGYRKKWRNGKSHLAHRLAYEDAFGPIPPGLSIDHLCRNPACINAAHLEAVPLGVNVLRGNNPAAQNARKTHCRRGHKFTPENTYNIKSGGRHCRECLRIRGRVYDATRRAKATA